MNEPSYPAARLVAGRIVARILRDRDEAGFSARGDSDEIDASVIEALVDAAFWASLRREEGLTPRISLALVPRERAADSLEFVSALPARPASLARLAPAVERPGIHLGVWPDDTGLTAWGTTRQLPPFCPVVEVVASGLIVVKYRGEHFGKFVNVAVLEGDEIKLVDPAVRRTPDCPGPVRSLLGLDPLPGSESVDVLVQLAASMRAHGRGGMLLVVPSGPHSWSESIVSPVLYSVRSSSSELGRLVAEVDRRGESLEWQDEMRRAVAALAGLTAVDGAVVLTDRLELQAFGAKVMRRRGRPLVERVIVTEPIEGATTAVLAPTQLGGTRHLSAAQFVQDQPGALALVASQDGRFTIFKWSPSEDAVHAHRVEALLL